MFKTRTAMRLRFLTLLAAFLLGSAQATFGIILLETDDPARNTSTPGDNSGWQYEGQFLNFLGTPIAPDFFITAHHIGGSVGDPFYFHGAVYQTTAVFSDPSSDLQIWQVTPSFPDYAPLYQAGTETGLELRVFGRGTQRGAEIDLDGTPRGWAWGASDNVQRWGRNVVTATVVEGGAPYLQAAFDSPGVPDEAHLSAGDSAGGVFVLEDGLWKLAGTNYGVDDLFTAPDPGTQFDAAIFDARGYYTENDDGTFSLIPDNGVNAPTSFYSTRTSARLDWIASVTGQDTATIPPENYPAWLTLYFPPAQIADHTVTGELADPDGDGVSNLAEFAFNLDPTFPEPVVMTADTGLRGLPLIRPEAIPNEGTRLTVEFVERTAASGSGITYTVEFASALGSGASNWKTGGTQVVTPINARWERVKVTDTVAEGNGVQSRFARVVVSPKLGANTAKAAATR